MRRLVVNTLAVATVLASASIGLGQSQPGRPPGAPPQPGQPGARPPQAPPGGARPPAKDKTQPNKSKLEEMLADALKNNPDIRVAAAKVAEADAELNRTRLQVTQKVVALYYAIDTQKKTVEYQEAKYKRLQNLAASAGVSQEDLEEGKQTLALAKAKLTELESEMPGLVGKTAHAEAMDRHSVAPELIEEVLRDKTQEQHKAQGPIADKIRQALEKPVSLKVSNEFIHEVLLQLQKQTGINIKLVADGLPDPKVNLEFTDISFRATLQYIEDSEPGYRFVIREYGILFAPEGKLPPGALTVQEFMRQKPTDAAQMRETRSVNPPRENVEGVIKQVDPKSGLMTISIGSDAGLSKGHTLDVYRLGEKPSESKYLGTIRIIDVEAKVAVAQPVGRLADTPKVGDKVASRILGDWPPGK